MCILKKKKVVLNTGNNQIVSIVCRQKKKGTILFKQLYKMIHRILTIMFFNKFYLLILYFL